MRPRGVALPNHPGAPIVRKELQSGKAASTNCETFTGVCRRSRIGQPRGETQRAHYALTVSNKCYQPLAWRSTSRYTCLR